MARRVPAPVRQIDADLSLLDKRAVILAWQAYQLEMCDIPVELFGEELDFHLDWSLKDGDAMGVLSRCLREVLMSLREVEAQDAEEWPILRDSLRAALPEALFTTLVDGLALD
jgi:hypothetical protein